VDFLCVEDGGIERRSATARVGVAQIFSRKLCVTDSKQQKTKTALCGYCLFLNFFMRSGLFAPFTELIKLYFSLNFLLVLSAIVIDSFTGLTGKFD
jgi:hypothetical protein